MAHAMSRQPNNTEEKKKRREKRIGTMQTQRKVLFEAIDTVQLWQALKESLALPNDTAVAFTHLERYL